MPNLRLAAAQLNTVVGDLSGNVERVLRALAAAEAAGADLCVVPELAIPGLPARGPPPQAGLRGRQRGRAREGRRGHRAVRGRGRVRRRRAAAGPGWPTPRRCAPAGAWSGVYRKRFLPNYGVFDEQRWFVPSDEPPSLFGVAGAWVGVSICEDVWFDDGPGGARRPGRRRRGGEPQRVALQPGPAGRAPRHAVAAGWPRPVAPSPT